jgi:tRNA-2-methylthio-N6-dimethylallyladenosine synthase
VPDERVRLGQDGRRARRRRRLRATADAAEADLILFNTCSVREKAQEKVFADLGRVKALKRRKPAC